MDEDIKSNLKLVVESSMLRKLSKSVEESDTHYEFTIRQQHLSTNISALQELFKTVDLKDNSNLSNDILSSLILLSKELQSKGEWNTEESMNFSKSLNSGFESLYLISIDDILKSVITPFPTQTLFDLCLAKLHSKLTIQEFKHYPSLVEVYCLLIESLANYKVKVTPSAILPISLLLIDDYNKAYKLKGLKCCQTILKAQTQKDFLNGNYHEVIYISLGNALREKDLAVTKLLLECFMEFMRILPATEKVDTMDNIFLKVLEEMATEANFDRKLAYFAFLQKFIPIHAINCVKRKRRLFAIIVENIDMCTNQPIRKVMLDDTLKCLKIWIQYCWSGFKYTSDAKLISIMLKIMYVLEDKERKHIAETERLLEALVHLSGKDNEKQIVSSLTDICNKNNKLKKRFDKLLTNLKPTV